MNVVLCYPPVLPGQKPNYGLQPLGILYIAAELRKNGIDVAIIDADIDGLTIKEMVERILESNPDLVGFSIMTSQLMSALEASTLLKKTRPSLPIVLGGAHISSTLEDTFSLTDRFDLAVYGEGEKTMVEIVQGMEKSSFPRCLEGIRGVIYRNDNGVVVTAPPRPFIVDLDSLPRLDYDLVNIAKYRIPTMVGRYVISMIITRGCPYHCTFCDAPKTMGRKLRWRSVDKALDDIKFYHQKYGTQNFVFKDSTFTANRKWVMKFCNAIIESGIKINWRCNARVDTVDEELIRLMKWAGCHIINFGVESGHSVILKNIRKEVNVAQVYYAHKLTRKYGIRTYSTFLVGSPGETDETMQTTIDFARRIRPSLAMFFVAIAYPGTVMYDEAVEEGMVDARWWVNQHWDPKTHSAFQKRWGWSCRVGLLKIQGLMLRYGKSEPLGHFICDLGSYGIP